MCEKMRIEPGSIQPLGPNRPDEAGKAARLRESGGLEEARGPEAAASAREIQAAAEAVRAANEVRAERVAELRAKIEGGELKIDPKAIADAIVSGTV
jgi:flagellar biosynthesis anti-sigma factor FlgM